MILIKTVSKLKDYLRHHTAHKRPLGFVPTMGALHEGHISLMKQSQSAAGFTVCSIFVNPTQFNDPADFEKYPVTLDRDIALLEENGVDLLFLPAVSEMYPQGTALSQHYELGELESRLEGAFRPGHFQGVCQVVERLLRIVEPDLLFLGQKDFQQVMVIEKMIRLKNLAVNIRVGATRREPDGLAMSSRNMRLSPTGRQRATALSQNLQYVIDHLGRRPLDELLATARQNLLNAGFDSVDYLELCDRHTLRRLDAAPAGGEAVLLAAAFLEGVRLIDNMVVPTGAAKL